MKRTVNLYWVTGCDEHYGYFVFASTPNKARALCVRKNSDDEDYISLRAYIMARNVGGLNNVVVEDETDRDYPRVLAAGCRFCTEEEGELWEDG
jgi:radical SAM superfamily enzyme with C-terminal helix-hairpin-helix motif